jgi:hypothetical protein
MTVSESQIFSFSCMGKCVCIKEKIEKQNTEIYCIKLYKMAK